MELFRMHKGRKNFLPFAQKSEVLLFHGADRLGLVDRKPLQEPAVFLPGKVPYLSPSQLAQGKQSIADHFSSSLFVDLDTDTLHLKADRRHR